MIGIYCITNILNGKNYIGQSIDIESRWRNHCKNHTNPNSSSYKTYFYQALRKYGIENFSFRVVEECLEEELDEKEVKWISILHSNDRGRGYNTTIGGDGVRGYWDKPVYQYDLDGNFVAEYKSTQEAKRQTGITSIEWCCNDGGKSAGGYMWSRIKYDAMPKYVRGHITTEVHQYGLDGKYIQSFPSILEASNVTGVAYGNISSCILSSSQARGGDYMWTAKKVDSLKPYKRNGRKPSPVRQLDRNGNIIAEYESLTAAFRATGIRSGNIWGCCEGRSKMAGGYQWQYTN